MKKEIGLFLIKKFVLMIVLSVGLFVYNISPASALYTECPAIGYSAGCSVLFTFGTGGSITTSFDSTIPAYDNIEDTLVGVRNNSGSTVNGLTLSGSGIFDFDGDGTATYGAGTYGTTGYEGPGTSFTLVDGNNGTINFTGGLANGGSAWFGLEGPPDGLNIVVPPQPPSNNNAVPEPATLLLLGSGLAGIAVWRKRLGRKEG